MVNDALLQPLGPGFRFCGTPFPTWMTVILTVLIENKHAKNMPLWLRPLARLDGIVAPNGKMPLDMWYSIAGHRGQFARALGQMPDWSPKTAVLARGDLLREKVPQRLREGFRSLAPLGQAN